MLESRFGVPLTIEQRRGMFVGKTGIEVVPLLLASMPEIQTVEIISYQRGLQWGEGYPGINQELIWGVARQEEFRRETVLSPNFWNQEAETLKTIEIPADSPISLEEVSALYREEGEIEEDEVYLAISSRVKVLKPEFKNREIPRHLILLDFTLPPSSESLVTIKRSLLESGQQKGVILFSGQSYHYHGLETLYTREWIIWMERWLRNRWTEPFVDSKFIARSLEDGYNFLRVTSGLSKPTIPIVVDVI